MKLIAAAFALIVSSFVYGGDFKLLDRDPSGVWYEYSGTVERTDSELLHAIMTKHRNTTVFVKINSGGGSAFGGIMLYWEAEEWDNLVTYAGKEYGAWSAAAIFWLGSPRDFLEPGSQVGFHAAYCNPYFPPGCNTEPFQLHFVEILVREGLDGLKFNNTLNELQLRFGVDAWIIKSDEGWFIKTPNRPGVKVHIPQGPRPLTPDRLEKLHAIACNRLRFARKHDSVCTSRVRMPDTTNSP